MMIAGFKNSLNDDLIMIRECLTNKDNEKITLTAHSLKTNFKFIHATELAILSEKIEQAGKDSDFDSLNILFKDLEKLSEALLKQM